MAGDEQRWDRLTSHCTDLGLRGSSLTGDLRVTEVQCSYQVVAKVQSSQNSHPHPPPPSPREAVSETGWSSWTFLCEMVGSWPFRKLKCLHRYPQRSSLTGNLSDSPSYSPLVFKATCLSPLHLGHSILGHPLHDPQHLSVLCHQLWRKGILWSPFAISLFWSCYSSLEGSLHPHPQGSLVVSPPIYM